ncbi:hypothetical protein, partial [Kitasatospora sp. LaBMicrA B282]|uniref:hypothetical protein n=1 Tax=Kitasatospora sp. LaBMicrA B282 TaxID=3420949 RepID=UPI003D126E4A
APTAPRGVGRLRSGLRGLWPALAGTAAVLLTVAAAVQLAGAAGTADRYRAMPSCDRAGAQTCIVTEDRLLDSVEDDGGGGGGVLLLVDGGGSATDPGYYDVAALPPAFQGLANGSRIQVLHASDGSAVLGIRYEGVTVAPEGAPDSQVGAHLSYLVAALLAAALFLVWTVASIRSHRRYPWWAPLCLPALLAACVVADRRSVDPAPLSAANYLPAALLLVAGLALGGALDRVLAARAARRAAAVAAAAVAAG